MKKGNVIGLAAAVVMSCAGVFNIFADTGLSDVKKYILLADKSEAGTLDTNKDGKINVFDACRIKNQVIYNKVPPVTTVPQDNNLSKENIYNAMIALKQDYPEGMPWTNANSYVWQGQRNFTGYGCAAFAFILSDAAFGKLPARIVYNISSSDIRTGDILRINNDTHSVIVLETTNEGVVVAEGNYNRSVHWGRKFSWSEIERVLTYVITRYPQ